jgi:hypothetical protein
VSLIQTAKFSLDARRSLACRTWTARPGINDIRLSNSHAGSKRDAFNHGIRHSTRAPAAAPEIINPVKHGTGHTTGQVTKPAYHPAESRAITKSDDFPKNGMDM